MKCGNRIAAKPALPEDACGTPSVENKRVESGAFAFGLIGAFLIVSNPESRGR